jgi:hypothetical protein
VLRARCGPLPGANEAVGQDAFTDDRMSQKKVFAPPFSDAQTSYLHGHRYFRRACRPAASESLSLRSVGSLTLGSDAALITPGFLMPCSRATGGALVHVTGLLQAKYLPKDRISAEDELPGHKPRCHQH